MQLITMTTKAFLGAPILTYGNEDQIIAVLTELTGIKLSKPADLQNNAILT